MIEETTLAALRLNVGLERMSLDDAIAHAEAVASCGGECGEEHMQLSKWLIELRSLRSNVKVRGRPTDELSTEKKT